MAGRSQGHRTKVCQYRVGPRLLATILGFCTVFALGYISTNSGGHQRFPHPLSCPSTPRSWSAPPQPKLHVLLLSYPRSGSSFLGDLLQSYSEAFYHFEPLHFFGDAVASNQLPTARRFLHDLFTCDYREWGSFPEWAWFNSDFLTLRRNKRYWDLCSSKDNSRLLCYNVCFLSAACRNSSVQIIKTIRMEASEAGRLLEDYPDLNLKVIHLVRDPRGTMNSRRQKDIALWCNKYKACSSPSTFCKLVEDDLRHACQLQRRFPNRYAVVRYEDLALDPPHITDRLFSFLGIGDVPAEVVQFLETHTQGGLPASTTSFLQPPYRTVRNSTQTALEWTRKMKLKDIHRVQRHCQSVLNIVGYKMVNNRTDLISENLIYDAHQMCPLMKRSD